VGLRIAVAVALASLLGASPVAQTVGTGQFIGRVTDVTGGVLPGVRVTVSGPGLHEEAITNEAGRFTVSGLVQGPPATYTVTVELVGFVTKRLDKIAAGPGRDVNLAVSLDVACLHEVDYVDLGLVENLKSADGVFFVRINSATPVRSGHPDPNCDQPTEYEAAVIDAVKHPHSVVPSAVRFVAGDSQYRYDTGAEYIAFLTWDANVERYGVSNPHYVVPVRAGWVEWRPFVTVGLSTSGPIGGVLEALRSLSTQH
jgi:Carboxypeptidase regulatory-like domain